MFLSRLTRASVLLVLREKQLPFELVPVIPLAPPPDVQAHLTTGRIARYLDTAGFRLAGPSREIFLQAPRDGRIENVVVEMAFPVEALRG